MCLTYRTYLQNYNLQVLFSRSPLPMDEEDLRYIQQNRDVCPICLEEFHYGDIVKILPCKHVFHMSCLDPWFLEQNASCPVCKKGITKHGMATITQSQIGSELVQALRRNNDK